MRERGLKQMVNNYRLCRANVAPHAGAWIETKKRLDFEIIINVAPPAGAWIETCN